VKAGLNPVTAFKIQEMNKMKYNIVQGRLGEALRKAEEDLLKATQDARYYKEQVELLKHLKVETAVTELVENNGLTEGEARKAMGVK